MFQVVRGAHLMESFRRPSFTSSSKASVMAAMAKIVWNAQTSALLVPRKTIRDNSIVPLERQQR